MSTGHIRRRGKNSWELKFDAGRDPLTRKRNIRYHSFRGNKRQAQTKLNELLAAVGKNEYIEPNKITVGQYVRDRIAVWETTSRKGKDPISPKTAERHRELLENQIAPHLGDARVQKLTTLDIETWHSTLRTNGRKDGKGGLSDRTILHAHRLLSKTLDDAVRHNLVHRNVASIQGAPGVNGASVEEVAILEEAQIKDLLTKLAGHPMYAGVVTALFTGLRRGELLALRWQNVDFDEKTIRVREALEETKKHGIRFKAAKTKSGRRDVTLPNIVLNTLREHRRRQLELRVVLGLGKMPDDALLFSTPDGQPKSPRAFSADWADMAERIGMPDITVHGLRHTHASQLIDAGIDVVKISKRLGHANPNITLTVYAHLFRKRDDKAADAINAALAQFRD